jgi:hypothetical protein
LGIEARVRALAAGDDDAAAQAYPNPSTALRPPECASSSHDHNSSTENGCADISTARSWFEPTRAHRQKCPDFCRRVTLPPIPFRAYGSAVEADVPLPRAKSLAPTGHTLLRHRLFPERGGFRRLWTDLTVDPRVVQVEVLNRRGVPAYRVNVVPLAWEGANPFDGAEGLRVFILPWRGWLGGERRRGGRQDQATSDEQGEDSPRHDPTLFPTGRARQSGTTARADAVSGLLRQTGGFERRCHPRS